MVIQQELSFQQLNDINSDPDWWSAIYIIKVSSVLSQLMKWDKWTGSITNEEMNKIEFWNKWKQVLTENNNNDDSNFQSDQQIDIDMTNEHEIDINMETCYRQNIALENSQLQLDYSKVTKNPSKYRLNSANIFRLYDLCHGKNEIYKEIELVKTELVMYICGTEWNDNPEIQKTLNNNPIWDDSNNKQKSGTGFSIKYAMAQVFGIGGFSKNWHQKKALYFTLNDKPVTYASHNTNNEQQYMGTHWFSMSVQQYHQSDKITRIDWNIFDSFNDKDINQKHKDAHIVKLRSFLDYIYNTKLKLNINIPVLPQKSNDYFSCGLYCALPLNYLMKLTTIWKNQHKDDEDLKMSEIDQIEMSEGMKEVTTLRELLTKNIRSEYKLLKKNVNSLPFTDIQLQKNHYINYKFKNDDEYSTQYGRWKYCGQVQKITADKPDDKIRVVGIDRSNNNIVDTTALTQKFFKNYQWKLMNETEIDEYKEKYAEKVNQHLQSSSNAIKIENASSTGSKSSSSSAARKRRRTDHETSSSNAVKKLKTEIPSSTGSKSSSSSAARKRSRTTQQQSDDSSTDSSEDESAVEKKKEQRPPRKKQKTSSKN